MPSLLKLLWTFVPLILGVLGVDTGFSVDGLIDGASATDASFNTGGSLTVNGFAITIPKNLQVGFPASWVPWKDFVAAWTSGSFPGFEVSVAGNFVNGGPPIAAQVYVSQLFTQASVGFISAINPTQGTIKISNGPTIRINDPNGIYSVGYTGSPFMTADDESPSISSFSGFPMCIPRSDNDPLCPASNRPNIPGTTSKQGTLTAPDPLVMAPFVVGDYLEFSGFKNAAGEIVCYSIVATNIQIRTGGAFSYIRMEDANIGVFSADPNAEVAQTRFVGFTSDTSGSPVTISAIDVNVCTGQETYRAITTASIVAGEPRNKFDQRLRASQASDRYTREYRITTTAASRVTKNNITAGVYLQPVTEWIQPELSVPGAAPLANDFSAFNHLTQGLGPDESGNIWGPLNPFPQSGVRVFDISTCGTTTPPPPPTSPDTVRVTSATWISSGGGTLTVGCTSNNTNSAVVGMVLDYVSDGATISNVGMTASTTTPGTWNFSGTRIKNPTRATCRSELGGSASSAVTIRRRRG